MTTKDTNTANIKHSGSPRHDRDAPIPTPLPVPTPPPGLPLYLAEKVWEWDQQIPVMETKETKDAPKGPPPVPPVEVYLAADVQAQLRAPDRWKATVILALITAGIYLPVHEDDPRLALNDLLVANALPAPHTPELVTAADTTEPEGRRR